MRAVIAAREGFLEQVACTPSTRVHESLLAVECTPREIHAALLLIGLEPGRPGRWSESADGAGGWRVERVSPTGPCVEIRVCWSDAGGVRRECAVEDWVRRIGAPAGEAGDHGLPRGRFVFAGSQIRPNPPSLGPGEHYVADFTGSVIGLVTFGDEVVAMDEVIADRADVEPPSWVAWTERMPPEGTAVELLIRACPPRR